MIMHAITTNNAYHQAFFDQKTLTIIANKESENKNSVPWF